MSLSGISLETRTVDPLVDCNKCKVVECVSSLSSSSCHPSRRETCRVFSSRSSPQREHLLFVALVKLSSPARCTSRSLLTLLGSKTCRYDKIEARRRRRRLFACLRAKVRALDGAGGRGGAVGKFAKSIAQSMFRNGPLYTVISGAQTPVSLVQIMIARDGILDVAVRALS